MSKLIPQVTNDYSKLLNGEDLDDEKPYYKAVRFGGNYTPKHTMWGIKPSKLEEYRNPLAESSQSAVFKTAATEQLNEEKFKEPYGPEFKKLLYDMDANDYIANTATNIRSWAAFQQEVEPVVMPIGNTVFESQEELDKALNDTGYDEDQRKELIKYVENVDRITGMSYYKPMLARQAMVGGRAALFIETFLGKNKYDFPVGTPAVIKPLHWSFLNQVRVNTTSWKLKSVRYTDFETQNDPQVFIPAEKLIYVTRNDDHVTPNNLYYGLSDYHSIWKISNIIRQCEEVDIPEIVTSMWAGGGIFKFQNMNTNEMDTFMRSVGPGLYRGFNNRIDFIPVPLKHDGWFIITLLQNMISHMLMKLRVPEFLFSFDKATSRSSVEIQMNVFRDIAVNGDRTWLERPLDDQWYSNLVALRLGEEARDKIKIVRQYKPLTFEDILAKANSLELLARRFFIDRFEGRVMMNLPPHNKNLDSAVNAIGQLKDFSPVEKLQQDRQDQLMKEQQQQAPGQTNLDQFQRKNPVPPTGQKGFTNTAPIRTNSAPIGTPGAGRGNKT